MEFKLDETDLTKLMESARLILPIVKLNAMNSVNGLDYLLNKIDEIGKSTLICTISDSNEFRYRSKVNKFRLDLNSEAKSNSIAKVIFYQLIAEEAERIISHTLSCIYNFKYRNTFIRDIYATCPSSSSIRHVFDLFRQAISSNDRLPESTVDLIPRLGMTIFYANEN